MEIDLFQKSKSMRERVLEFCKKKYYVSSIDLQNFMEEIKQTEGIVPGLLRIHREARELAEQGYLKRLDDAEKRFRFGYLNPKYAIYQYVHS